MPTITSIQALPSSPLEGSGLVAIVITSGLPSYFRILGTDLDKIKSVRWFPKNPSSVLFVTRQVILVNPTEGTFMIKVTDNFLDTTDRRGTITFTFDDDSTVSYPVITYGPVSAMPLWNAPSSGINTG